MSVASLRTKRDPVRTVDDPRYAVHRSLVAVAGPEDSGSNHTCGDKGIGRGLNSPSEGHYGKSAARSGNNRSFGRAQRSIADGSYRSTVFKVTSAYGGPQFAISPMFRDSWSSRACCANV